MAVELLYDNGVPPLSPAKGGWNGELLSYTEASGNAEIIFGSASSPTYIPSQSDVAIVYNTSDLQDFAVYYITGSIPTGPGPLGLYPVGISAKVDKNFYDFEKQSGETYMVVCYSVSLYSELASNYANSYRITSNIERLIIRTL